jgi:signal transduction histidine kinase/DNA-binding response OmpR family regulator
MVAIFKRFPHVRLSLPRARQLLVTVGALCALALLFGTYVILNRDRELTLHTENERGMLLASMLESHITRTLSSVDNSLNAIGSMLLRSRSLASDSASQAELQAQLDTVVSSYVYLRSLSILDSTGRVILSSTPDNLGRHFSNSQLGLQRELDNLLQVGRPLFAHDLYELDERIDNDSLRERGVYALPFAKQFRIGAANLTLVALLHPPYLFPEERSASGLGKNYAVLFDYQGMALAATPNSPYAIGQRHARLPMVSALNLDKEFGAFRLQPEAGPGGGAHLINFQASRRYPLAALVGAREDDVLAEWEDSVRDLRFIGVFAALLGLLYSALLHRVMRSGEKTREELHRAKDAAESANAAKSAFLSTMSHEIRTPMNGVLGMTALLRETPLDAQQQEFARTIEDSAGALMAIINDILDFSKIEAGRMDLAMQPCALPQLAEGCIDLLSGKAAQRRLKLALDIDPALPASVLVDGGRLRQILLNLLDNALKFTEAGTVALRIALLERRDGACRIGFEVSDSGIGIAPHVLPRLFQPFTQADSSVTRKYGGTGLGLSICKRLLEMMGSAISVESALGRGSAFRFELRLRELAAPQEALAATPPADHAARASGQDRHKQERLILLAEDNPTNRKLALYQLQGLGYQAHVATDGEQALAALERHDYALVLMDCQMPLMDGFEATRRIREREHGRGRHLPIIAMTANAMEGDRERCLQAGMDDYLPKPVHADALAGMLRRHLPPQREAALPVLDAARLTELFGADRDMQRSLLQDFQASTLGLLQSLETALAAADFDEAGKTAHQLTGSSANLGASELEALARQLRQTLHERDAGAARQLHAALFQAWQRLAGHMAKEEG